MLADLSVSAPQLKINRSQRSKILRGIWQEGKIEEKFAESRWSKNLEKDVVVSANDDDDVDSI